MMSKNLEILAAAADANVAALCVCVFSVCCRVKSGNWKYSVITDRHHHKQKTILMGF